MEIQLSPEELLALKQANLIKELTMQEGWREVFLPYLQSKISHSWVDPRKTKNDKELLYQYKTAWAFAQAAEEIIAFVEEAEETGKKLLKKQRGEEVDKLKESLS